MDMILEILIWWFIVQILGFLALPISLGLLKNLPDKGYFSSKILGILFFCYLNWILSHFMPYGFPSIFVSLTVLLVLFIFFQDKKSLKSFFFKNSKIVKTTELLFLISMFFFTIIRAHTPAAEGLEKLFDMSMINGILKSERMPPLDPWYIGGKINYYYFGHFIVATLTKLSFLPSYITFNLALGLLFSLSSGQVFSLCYNLTRKISFGLFEVFLLLILGNMLGFLQMLTFIDPSIKPFFIKTFDIEYAMTCCHDDRASFLSFLSSLPVWSSTRIIPGTINEFPYASFLFGEVHSHILSIPIQLLLLSVFLNIFKSKINFKEVGNIKEYIHVFLLISFLLGAIYFTNSWDFPTYIILFGSVLFYFLLRNFSIASTRNIIFIVIFTVLLSFIFFLPFNLEVKKSLSYGLAKEKSNLFQILIIFPVFLYSISSFIFKKSKPIYLIGSFLVSIALSFIFKASLLLVLGLTIPSFIILWNNRKEQELNYILILFILGSFVLIFCEFGYIDSRYNSVFKFYYHVWIFWSLASVFFLFEMWRSKGVLFKVILFLLILACCTVTVFSTLERLRIGWMDKVTLDGLYYMKKYHPSDYDTVMWARENIKEKANILEAPGWAFTYTSIFSTYTGLQTMVGWDNHVAIHRGTWPTERVADANEAYNTTDTSKLSYILNKYDIDYVFVGSVERSRYSPEGLSKFDKFELVKEFSGGNKIFKVK